MALSCSKSLPPHRAQVEHDNNLHPLHTRLETNRDRAAAQKMQIHQEKKNIMPHDNDNGDGDAGGCVFPTRYQKDQQRSKINKYQQRSTK